MNSISEYEFPREKTIRLLTTVPRLFIFSLDNIWRCAKGVYVYPCDTIKINYNGHELTLHVFIDCYSIPKDKVDNRIINLNLSSIPIRRVAATGRTTRVRRADNNTVNVANYTMPTTATLTVPVLEPIANYTIPTPNYTIPTPIPITMPDHTEPMVVEIIYANTPFQTAVETATEIIREATNTPAAQ